MEAFATNAGSGRKKRFLNTVSVFPSKLTEWIINGALGITGILFLFLLLALAWAITVCIGVLVGG